jgi:hypothetical protein
MKLEVGHGATQGYVRVQARGGTANPSTRGDGGAGSARVVSNWYQRQLASHRIKRTVQSKLKNLANPSLE